MAEEINGFNGIGGYDVVFAEDVSKQNIICSICLFVLRETMQAVPCGHRFCKNCIELEIERQGTENLVCPYDRIEIQVFPDVGRRREILDLRIKCSNERLERCPWNGELRNLEEHLKQCPFQLLECEKDCGQKISRKKEHLKQCPFQLLECEKDCGQKISRKKMKEHLEDLCPKNLKCCKYSIIGCHFKGMSSCLEKHIKDEFDHHLYLQVTTQEDRISDLEKDLQRQCNQNETLQNNIIQFEEKITKLEDEKQKQAKEINEHLRQQDDMRKEMDHLSLCCIPKCPFVFKVDNALMLLKTESLIKIFSKTFRILNGYQGRLRVDIFCKAIAIYLHIVRGPLDDTLEWPMLFGKVTFKTIVNGETTTKTLNCENYEKDAKPKNKPEEKLGCWGFAHMPIDKTKLEKDDKIKIVVDVKDI